MEGEESAMGRRLPEGIPGCVCRNRTFASSRPPSDGFRFTADCITVVVASLAGEASLFCPPSTLTLMRWR
ncbi:hypothetical protein Ddc_05960 [Ditylenchus destructor]|nr:hypothetical protein Ddc_05960 [Ditylenchus destructor]